MGLFLWTFSFWIDDAEQDAVKKLKRFILVAVFVFAWVCVSIFFLWALGVFWNQELLPHPFGPVLAVTVLVAFAVLFWRLGRKNQWLTYAGIVIIAAWLLLQTQQPSHDRNWAKDQEVLATINFDDDRVTIHGFRHAKYRSESDFEVGWSDFSFELSELERVWFVVQLFTTGEGLAHVFLTFEVDTEDYEPEYFAVSVEIRREANEYFSPTLGLYRRYELNYVFGDERDLVGVRTIMRPDDRVFMYPVNATPDQVQQLFVSIADRTNQIAERPEFYHTLLNNCMNGILRHTVELTHEEISWFDPKILMPGFSDQYAYDKGIIGNPGQSFDDLEAACRIDQRAREFGIKPGFSKAIRNEKD